MNTWLCRAGKFGEHELKFLEDKGIYCTWDNIPMSLESFIAKDDLQNYFSSLQTAKHKTVINWVSQVWPFVHVIRAGDRILLPSKINQVVYVGIVTGGYEFHENNAVQYRHFRRVAWKESGIPRKDFDQDILYSLGSMLAICKIKQTDRVEKIISKFTDSPSAQIEIVDFDAPDNNKDIENEAFEEISSMIIQKFKGHGLAKMIASILRAKGYVTYLSPEGPDKGVDILASSGMLGFDGHKLCVQVKATEMPVDRPTLDQLIGTMSNFKADNGLLASWGGFKNSVLNETANQFFKVRLWNHIDITREFLAHYDQLDDDIKSEISLKKIWVVDTSRE